MTTSELRESMIVATEKTVTKEALRALPSLTVHPQGSIVVAMYGATIGRLGILGVDAAVNQACCVFSRPKQINVAYWYYWLQMRRPYLISLGYGGGQPNLSQELLRSVRVPTPSEPEQATIAAFLDHETARIDALVAKKERLIELLQEKRAAFITQAVTKGLDPNVPMKDSGVEWLGTIPAHWNLYRLKTILSLFNGYAFDGSFFSRDDIGSPILVTPGSFHPDGGLYFSNENTTYFSGPFSRNFELSLGDHLIVMTDLSYKRLILGRCARVEREGLLLNQRVAKIVPRPTFENSIDFDFLRSALNSTAAREQVIQTARGTTVFHSSPDKIGNVWLAMPPVEEQKNIFNYIRESENKLVDAFAKIRLCIDRLKEFRTALISAAVTGKVDVREEAA